jgi:hypothetical protein
MSADIEVIEADSSRLKNIFIELPYQLYKEIPYWVPPLLIERKEFFDLKKNPFYRTAKTRLYLARQNGRYVGRIATCINYNHNEYHMENVGFFGFFDTVDDFGVASRLLKVAMIKLKSEGMEKMRGPANFSTNHEIGFLIDGFDMPPTVMNPYNPPFLPRFAEQFGLKKVMDLYAYKITKETPISARLQRLVERIKERNRVQIRKVDFSHFDEEVKIINKMYNEAWQFNWGFVPMGDNEFRYMARHLKEIVDEDLAMIAEINGEPAGFCIAVPDINQVLIRMNGHLFPFGIFKLLWNTKVRNKIDGIRLITMGVIPRFQKRGVDSIFFVETYNRGVEKGYQWAELSWILEKNDMMNRAAENMGAVRYKTYRLVEMPI